MLSVIKVPQHNVNDDYVMITEWYVNDFDYVEKGKPICAIETSKAVIEMEAEASGYIKKTVNTLHEVKPQSVIGYLATTKEELDDVKIPEEKKQKNVSLHEGKQPRSKKISDKARKLAKELKVDLEKIDKKIIRAKDLYLYKKKREGFVDKEFLRSILKDEKFDKLPSAEKISLYKKNGAKISDGMIIGRGSKILSGFIEVGEKVRIGRNVYIGADRFEIGSLSSIGDNTRIVTGIIQVGEATEITSDVTVDLSGGRTKDSKFIVGDKGLIAANAYINACRAVEIGDNVALSPYSKIYTHGYWQSVLDGYSADFKGVTIKENSWIGSGAQIMPGVLVNSDSIILSNSTVVEDVAPNTMVGGVPAQIIKKNLKKKLSIEVKTGKMIRILKEFAEYLNFKQCETENSENDRYFRITLNYNGEIKNIVLVKNGDIDEEFSNAIVLTFTGAGMDRYEGVYALFDLEASKFTGKEDVFVKELKNFLRRYGIKFNPPAQKMRWEEGLRREP